MTGHKTIMIDIPSPWDEKGPSRAEVCREVDERLDEIAAEGWILVGTQIIEHCGNGWKRVLLATFRRGKPKNTLGIMRQEVNP